MNVLERGIIYVCVLQENRSLWFTSWVTEGVSGVSLSLSQTNKMILGEQLALAPPLTWLSLSLWPSVSLDVFEHN